MSPFEGELSIEDPTSVPYTVTVQYPGQPPRSFVGWLFPRTWEQREEYCIYAGDGNGGKLNENELVSGPNDPVMEGTYSQYKVDSEFSTDFEFAHFDETMCN